MKVYVFYVPKETLDETIVLSSGSVNCMDEVKYDLYAYTTNSYVKDEFIRVRNMDKFKLKIYDMKSSIYKNFKMNYKYRELKYLKLRSESKDNFVSVLSTKRELSMMNYVIENKILYGHIIKYVSNSALFTLDDDYIILLRKILNDNIDEIIYDELAIYISLYTKLFRIYEGR